MKVRGYDKIIQYLQKMADYEIEKKEDLITIMPKNHRHSLIWMHGLGYYPQTNLDDMIQALGSHLEDVKVLIPRAPTRFVTVANKQTRSWFDIKFRGEKSFLCPFDEAFSSAQVFDSYERILKPLIGQEREILDKNTEKGLIVVAGFSQGCGMSLHCLYECDKVDCALGIAGYLFPITKFDPQLKKKKKIIYGLDDPLRPWELTKVTYDGKIPEEQIRLIPGMKHELNPDTLKEMKVFFDQIFTA